MSLIGDMSRELLLTPAFIGAIARTASRRYKTYTVQKRSGGTRTIHHPSKVLKVLQRWLLRGPISAWPVHPAATAYRQGSSIKLNVQPHLQNKYVLKVDFAEFFPSISNDDLVTYMVNNRSRLPRWDEQDIQLFSQIVCRNNRLTIGAPTSPALSNAVCFELDERVAQWSCHRSVVYTRYADDITLSCSEPNVLSEGVAAIEEVMHNLPTPRNLSINRRKIRHLSTKNRRVVTGLVLTDNKTASLGRGQKRKIRALIHRFEKLSTEDRTSLAGLLAYAFDIEPDLRNRLTIKYGQSVVALAMRTQP